MKALSLYMVGQMEKRMVTHLRSRYRTQTAPLDDTKLRALIRAGIQRAAGYGIEEEFDVRRFLEYEVLHGPSFDASLAMSWTQGILGSGSLSGTEKMDLIDAQETFDTG